MWIKISTFDEPVFVEADVHPATDVSAIVVLDQFNRPWVFDCWDRHKEGDCAVFVAAMKWVVKLPQAASLDTSP